MKKLVNYEYIDMSDEEIAELKASKIEYDAIYKTIREADIKRAADRTSGKKKLKDLGLTDDEITALMTEKKWLTIQ